MLSSVITYILVEYGTKRLLREFQPLLVVGILFHVMCHLLMCLITFSPVEKVRVLEKRESDKNRFVTYFGEVYIKTQEVSFLKAVLVGLAPSFLSYWFFIYLLDIIIYTHVHVVTLFFLIFIMISLIFSANPSHTDLELIPEAFDNNVINSLYQLLLIFLSGLITWYLIRTYNLQLPHEIFMYLIIAGFYFLLKYGFKITGYILSSMNIERNKLKKKKSIVEKRSYLKKLWKLNEKDSSTKQNVVRQTKTHVEQLDKKSEFKEEKYEDLINEDNDLIQEEINSFVNNEMSNKKSQVDNNDSSNNNFKNKLISNKEGKDERLFCTITPSSLKKNQCSIDFKFNNEYLEENFYENNIVSDTTLSRNKDKFRLFRDLGFSPIKCKECDADITLLVALQLHHPTDHKEITLSDFYIENNYYLALEKFKKDKVEILCSNHHLEKQVFYPHIFRDLIFKKDLFLMSTQEIDEYIDRYLSEFFKTEKYFEIINEKYISKNEKVPDKIKVKWKYQIKKWLKKRFCFEELFNGKCIVCGDSNLLHLILHHVFPELKSIISNWQSISRFDCKEIMHLIIQEKCICLCSNCHVLITSKFHLTIREVLDGFILHPELNKICEDVISKYNIAIINISNYRYNLKDINFRSPFKLEFSQDKRWKIHLIMIYYYLKKKEKNYYYVRQFSNDMQLEYKTVLKFTVKLVNLNFINKDTIENYEIRYSLTELGRNTVMFLINNHSKKARGIRDKINNIVRSKYNYNTKSFDSYQDILVKYPIKIYKIIKEKGINEFTSKELAIELGKSVVVVNKHIRTKLITNDIIDIVDNPISRKKKPITNKNPPSREKVYSLTPKGFKRAKKELDTNNKNI